jgi:hypothetical protein
MPNASDLMSQRKCAILSTPFQGRGCAAVRLLRQSLRPALRRSPGVGMILQQWNHFIKLFLIRSDAAAPVLRAPFAPVWTHQRLKPDVFLYISGF